jgi:LacI family transcriptional regulator
MRGKEIPLAVLGNHVSGKWQDELFDVVWFDDIQGTYEATRYLLSLGHRHIWFAGNCRLSWAARRYQGYTRAMTEAGLHPQLSELDSDDYFELGYLSTKSIMSRGNLLTAIVAGSDEIAQGAYSALRDCGLEIPRDVSVAGFDDIGAALLHPPLTTVSGFPDRVGNQLAQILLERIAHPDLPPQHRIIPTRLVKRESHRSLAPESVKESEAHGQGASMISDGASSQTSQVA